MKHFLSLAIFYLISLNASAQFVAKMQVTEPIPGICNEKEVYAILPFKDQVEAKAPLTKEEILTRLNAEVAFLKEKPKYKDKGMVSLVVNCKGEMVQCKTDNKTKSAELDAQIVAVFNTMKTWKAATLNSKEVDSLILYSFSIKKGKITFD